jgi:hypothetical protein
MIFLGRCRAKGNWRNQTPQISYSYQRKTWKQFPIGSAHSRTWGQYWLWYFRAGLGNPTVSCITTVHFEWLWLFEKKISQTETSNIGHMIHLCYPAVLSAEVHKGPLFNQAFHVYTWNYTRLLLRILSYKIKPASPMKQFLLWLDNVCWGVGFGKVCSRSHWQFYLELIKLTRTLGLMQHAANSRVNCKTVRADEDGVSMKRNQILWIDK